MIFGKRKRKQQLLKINNQWKSVKSSDLT